MSQFHLEQRAQLKETAYYGQEKATNSFASKMTKPKTILNKKKKSPYIFYNNKLMISLFLPRLLSLRNPAEMEAVKYLKFKESTAAIASLDP